MKLYHYLILTLLIGAVGLAGCASAPGSPTQQGAIIGAAGGALAGQAIGEDTEATLLGAATGAAAGALIGEQVGNQQERAAATAEREETIRRQEEEIERLRRERELGTTTSSQDETIRRQQEEIERLRREAAAAEAEAREPRYEPSAAEQTRSAARTIDPTAGEFVNNTGWLVEVFIDSTNLQGRPDLTLEPYERVPETLDIGSHRIYAIAHAETSQGLRTVGEFNQVIDVDVRGRGWNVTFTEASF